MPLLELSPGNALYFEHSAPSRDGAPTFVFVNALTGNTQAWEAVVAPTLRAAGFGTLSYNFRGQDGSPFTPETALTPELIVDDLCALIDGVAPVRPVLCGLSIGGLFGAQAVLKGVQAEGLVLLNTLRVIGPRIGWVNDALPHLVSRGGVRLFLDAFFPLLVNQEFAAKNREAFLGAAPYEKLDPTHGHMNLMQHSPATDWDISYQALSLPVHVITGAQDRVFRDPDIIDALFARLPNATREDWADTGHLVPQERPEKLATALANFGARIEGRAA